MFSLFFFIMVGMFFRILCLYFNSFLHKMYIIAYIDTVIIFIALNLYTVWRTPLGKME